MTGLSYPASPAFPRGPKWSRLPLPPLTHFNALSSPPAQSRLRRSFSERPLTRIYTVSHWTGFIRVTASPVSVSPNLNGRIGSKMACLPPAPVSAAPARITRHAAKAVCKRLATFCVVFRHVCDLQLGGLRYVLFKKAHSANLRAGEHSAVKR